MLGRYRIVRGKRPEGDPLPEGTRQDTRKHTSHVLRPDADKVQAYLRAPGEAAWRAFTREYRRTLDKRWRTERDRFEEIAELARSTDLWLGCSCPTTKNPDVRHCHTFLALQYLEKKYPDLRIVWP